MFIVVFLDIDELSSSDESETVKNSSNPKDYLKEMNLKEYLIQFFRTFKEANEHYGSFLERITERELAYMKQMNLLWENTNVGIYYEIGPDCIILHA